MMIRGQWEGKALINWGMVSQGAEGQAMHTPGAHGHPPAPLSSPHLPPLTSLSSPHIPSHDLPVLGSSPTPLSPARPRTRSHLTWTSAGAKLSRRGCDRGGRGSVNWGGARF